MRRIFTQARLSHLVAVMASGAALAFAAPVQAQENDNQQQQRVAPRAEGGAASTRQVCRRIELTATRVARRVCRTQAEWDRESRED